MSIPTCLADRAASGRPTHRTRARRHWLVLPALLGALLPAVPSEAATCNPLSLVAAKTYNPSAFQPAVAELAAIMAFAIPAEIPVTQGNAGNHTMNFRYHDLNFNEVNCTYKGGASVSHPTTPSQIQAGLKYRFRSCSNGKVSGNIVETSFVHLNVTNGDALAGRTQVTLNINPTGCRDILFISLGGASTKSYPAGQVLPLQASVNPTAGSTVTFKANGVAFATDSSAPFEAGFLMPEAVGTATVLQATLSVAGQAASSSTITVTTAARPAPQPVSAFVEAVSFSAVTELGVLTSSDIRVHFSEPINPSSLGTGLKVKVDDVTIPVASAVSADGRIVTLTPQSPLAAETFHSVIVRGVTTASGSEVVPDTSGFLTETGRAFLAGTILNGEGGPLEGVPVRLAHRTAYTDEKGAFLLSDIPTGHQHLHVDPVVIAGLSYPELSFLVDIVPGLHRNGLGRPIYLPALDDTGGLDIVNGYPVLSTTLGSEQVPGMALNLSGSRVFNQDGTPFTGRMSISMVKAENLPMPLIGIYSSSFVTVQPGGLLLVPPAPITYPNLDQGRPGEQVPLWHYDHDVEAWVTYGNATVTSDGTRFTSNPGQGLPKTGWGTPQARITFTTVAGRVLDEEGSPLPGVLVQAETAIGYTQDDGTYALPNVPCGRAGDPPPYVRLRATAREIGQTVYWARGGGGPCVRSGITPAEDLYIFSYTPISGGKLRIHGDYRSESGAPGASVRAAPVTFQNTLFPFMDRNERIINEIGWLQKGLRALGFRVNQSAISQAGRCAGQRVFNCNDGFPLGNSGAFDEATAQAVRLFKAYYTYDSNRGVLPTDSNSAVVGPTTQEIFNRLVSFARIGNRFEPLVAREIWTNVPNLGGFVDWGSAGDCAVETGDDWGYVDLVVFLQTLQARLGLVELPVNDISVPGGGYFCPHQTHDTGLAVDFPIPTTSTDRFGRVVWGTTVGSASYNQALARQILQAAIDVEFVGRSVAGGDSVRFFGDSALCAESYRGYALCTYDRGHVDHFHIKIRTHNPISLTRAGFAGLTPQIVQVDGGDGRQTDVAVDTETILARLRVPLDPVSLNGRVSVSGPAGNVAGTVTVRPDGLSILFQPAGLLAANTQYTFTVAAGATTLTGEPLTAPLTQAFITEVADSLRILLASPEHGSETVSTKTRVVLRFDEPLDPRTLTSSSVKLVYGTSQSAFPIHVTLDASRKELTVQPQTDLVYPQHFSLKLDGSLRSENGLALSHVGGVSSFSTELPSTVESYAVNPRSVVFTRQNLAPVQLQVRALGRFPGATEILLVPPYSPPPFSLLREGTALPSVVEVDTAGRLSLAGTNGTAVVQVGSASGALGFVKVDVQDVFPSVDLLGPSTRFPVGLPVTLRFSEPVNAAGFLLESIRLLDALGAEILGTTSISTDGRDVTFTPDTPLRPATSYQVLASMSIADPVGHGWAFNRSLPFETGAQSCARGRFEFPYPDHPAIGPVTLEVYNEDTSSYVPVSTFLPAADGSFCVDVVHGLQYQVRVRPGISDYNEFTLFDDPGSNGTCGDGDTSDCIDQGVFTLRSCC